MGEPTIEDQPVDGQPPPLTFEVIEGASKRGQEKLFDSRGHSYCVKLTLLSKAKRWYVDGTFKLCRPPFTQLFTINAFVRQDDHAKQVPLLFVLMSSKRKHDYKKVLKKVLRMLPTTPSVEQVTADFESAVWGAFRKVLPEVQLLGCAFHWNQAL